MRHSAYDSSLTEIGTHSTSLRGNDAAGKVGAGLHGAFTKSYDTADVQRLGRGGILRCLHRPAVGTAPYAFGLFYLEAQYTANIYIAAEISVTNNCAAICAIGNVTLRFEGSAFLTASYDTAN